MSAFTIPSDVWKRNRTRIARRVRRGLNVQEINPGPEFHLRFDYILTASQVTRLVEEVMIETERLITYMRRKEGE